MSVWSLLLFMTMSIPVCSLTLQQRMARIERRSFIASSVVAAAAAVTSTLLVSPPLVSRAETETNDDLASTLYNPDGSIRDDIAKEAKERLVSFSWGVDEMGIQQVDGKSTTGSRRTVESTTTTSNSATTTDNNSKITISYKLPAKWVPNEDGSCLYMDQSEGINARAANHIYVYQAPGLVNPNDMERASTIGVGKALQVIPELQLVNEADLVSGRKTTKNGQLYYEFDMASAPKTCGDSAQNLGLGFCPFDHVFLLSATLSEQGRLYVFCVECDTAEWKQANADLKRVRSSFSIKKL